MRYSIGERFGRLVALGPSQRRYANGKRLIKLRCDCGNETDAVLDNLRNGRVRSCGCLLREYLVSKNRTHGLSATREYRTWKGLRRRCTSDSSPDAIDYKARGITVCDRWSDFAAFLADMGACPSQKHSIDRIDNDGPYSPENCRWATASEQANNKRSNYRICVNGRTYTVAQLAVAMKLPASTIYHLVNRHGDHWLRVLSGELIPPSQVA
jgi:hypothetical protein